MRGQNLKGRAWRGGIILVGGALLLLMGALTACASREVVTTVGTDVLISAKVDKTPALDGQPEALWDKAKPMEVLVRGGANTAYSLSLVLKSVYTADSIYFLAQWSDPTESMQRTPWQKQADGSWMKLGTSTTNQENTYYEDGLSFIWNINDSMPGFNEQSCMPICHSGEKPAYSAYGNKYAAPGGFGDLWYWGVVRTNSLGQFDDGYLDDKRYDVVSAPRAGMRGDPEAGGGYRNNETADGKLPAFGLKGNKVAPPYWIPEDEKVAFDDTKYKAGDEVPSLLVAPFTGDRADISSKGVYQDGKWTVEWGRKLNTGSQYDIQYTDMAKRYFLGVAVFDNSQVNHGWGAFRHYELRFAP